MQRHCTSTPGDGDILLGGGFSVQQRDGVIFDSGTADFESG